MYIFYVSKYITAKEFWVVENEILQKLFAMCAQQTDTPLAINNYHSPLYKNQPLVYCIENKVQWFAVTPLDGSTNVIHEYAVLRISDKQQLEILVLLALYVPCINVHRYTTIVINDTVAHSSVGPWNPSSDNANSDRVSMLVHMITSGINCIELAAWYEFVLRYACGYGYKQTHIGLQKPYCCIIWSSNLNVWML